MKIFSFVFILIFCLNGLKAYSKPVPSDSVTKSKRVMYRASTAKTNDILHTRLDVEFDWKKSEMNGKASIVVKPYSRSTSKLDLDARGMVIKSLEVFDLGPGKTQAGLVVNQGDLKGSKKLNATYKYENDSIKINLGREFNSDEKYLVKIDYVARPNTLKNTGSSAISDDRGLFFINPNGEDKNKMPQIWTQGETQASSAWFPTIDSPNEKMTSEIFMTVDSKYTTLSNGLLSETKKNTDGTKTDHWKMDLPHSPYLVMMAVGEFKKVTDTPWNGKEVSYYVEKEYETHAKSIFGNTNEMIDFYSKVLQTPYPWQKYSQIVVRDYVSGAMENTSATLHGDFMVYQTEREMLDGKKGEAVIAHELFHQWFGDLVTAESWSNLPLNESFATYGEYLWEEYKNGRDAADARSYQSRMRYYSASNHKQVDVIRFEYESKEDMFDAWSYNKGGQILHMLRKYTGDKIFFESLKLYLERNRFKAAEIHDLRLAFEEVSGEDLNWFFNQWFLEKGHPELDIQKNYEPATKLLRIKVKQKQNLNAFPLYTLPVDIDIYVSGKKQRHRIIIDQVEQEFSFPLETNPDLVNFDAEKQLLAIKNYQKTGEELVFQYRNAPLFSDRLEALAVLKNKLDQEDVYNLFIFAAEKDNWYEHRISAIEAFNSVAVAKESELKPLLMKIVLSDKKTQVRAQAITFLSAHYTGIELNNLYKKSCDDQSYLVAAAALKALSKVEITFCLQKAKEFENEKNIEIFQTLALIYTKIGADENNSYFLKCKDYFPDRGHGTYLTLYGIFLKKRKQPQIFESAAPVFLGIIKEGDPNTKESAIKAYNDFILGPMATIVEDMIIAKENTDKIKEVEKIRIKLVNDLNSVSTP